LRLSGGARALGAFDEPFDDLSLILRRDLGVAPSRCLRIVGLAVTSSISWLAALR